MGAQFTIKLPSFRRKNRVVEPVRKPKPVEQLKLLHAEIDRQRDSLAQRRSSMHTRAAILVAASGVLTTLQQSGQPSAWQVVAGVIALVAAVLGLMVMMPMKGDNVDITKTFKRWLGARPYDVEHKIATDNLNALEAGLARVALLARLVVTGYVALVVSWLVAFTDTFFTQ